MNYNIKIAEIIKSTINVEYQTLLGLMEMDHIVLQKAIEAMYECKGRIIVSGIGKSAIVARKIVATLNSTGTRAIFLHTTDALHGDLGMLDRDDILLLISKSGESREIKEIMPTVKEIGSKIIGLFSNIDGYLSKNADLPLFVPVSKEADMDDLAPTASAIAHICIGDAIAMSLKHMNGFTETNFAKLHPGGLLGKKLNLKVGDLAQLNLKPIVLAEDLLSKVIFEISSKRLGATCVVNKEDEVIGIITDGDIRRLIERGGDIYVKSAKEIMSANPKIITSKERAIDALEIMKQNSITQLLVVHDDNTYIGIVHLHDIIKEGIN